MERRNEWINDLKIAIINNDLYKIEKYANRDVPSFDSITKAKEALSIVQQAIKILEGKKSEVAKELHALKEMQKYTPSQKSLSTNDWKV